MLSLCIFCFVCIRCKNLTRFLRFAALEKHTCIWIVGSSIIKRGFCHAREYQTNGSQLDSIMPLSFGKVREACNGPRSTIVYTCLFQSCIVLAMTLGRHLFWLYVTKSCRQLKFLILNCQIRFLFGHKITEQWKMLGNP